MKDLREVHLAFVKLGTCIREFLLPQATESPSEICFYDVVRVNNIWCVGSRNKLLMANMLIDIA